MTRYISHHFRFLILLIGVATAFSWPVPAAAFTVYDSTLFFPKRPTPYPGFPYLTGLYAHDMWPPGTVFNDNTQVHEPSVRAAVSRFKAGDKIWLDVEHYYPVHTDQAIAKFRKILDIIHSQVPGINVGYFGQVPEFSHYTPITGENMAQWEANNRKLKTVADGADTIYSTAGYSYTCDAERWKKVVRGNITQAKKYGKPVYVFIYLRFMEAGGEGGHCVGKEITGEWMKMQLETIKAAGADGVVLWGGYTLKWDENRPWWIETKNFIDSLGQQPQPEPQPQPQPQPSPAPTPSPQPSGNVTVTNVAPAHGSVVSSLKPTLQWSAQNAVSYDVWFAVYTNAATKIASNITQTSFTLPNNLAPNKTYAWKIVARNAAGQEITGDDRTFRTPSQTAQPAPAPEPQPQPQPQPPGTTTAINIVAPAHGKVVSTLKPTLDWSAQGAVSFDVRFAVYTNAGHKIASNITQTSFTLPNDLVPNKIYAWQITARNAAGEEVTGPVWTFRTPVLVAQSQRQLQRQPQTQSQPRFQVYDSTLYGGRPDLSVYYDIARLPFVNASKLRTYGSRLGQLDEHAIRRAMLQFRAGDLVALNIGHWKVASNGGRSAEADTQIAKLRRVADIAHDQVPGLKLGYHGLLPVHNYYAPMTGKADWMAWKAGNERLKPLSEKVDAIFVSLLALEADRKNWVIYAKASIAEAKKYGKPVYAVLPRAYHVGHRALGNRPIGPAFWKLQLETVRAAGADGAIIRGGQGLAWDENAAWWIETKNFVERLSP